jgi:hypothetical protein
LYIMKSNTVILICRSNATSQHDERSSLSKYC